MASDSRVTSLWTEFRGREGRAIFAKGDRPFPICFSRDFFTRGPDKFYDFYSVS